MDSLTLNVNSVTNPSQIVKFGNMRISVLTSRLIRVERWIYRDEPTQRVWFRNFATPEFTTQKNGTCLSIHTQSCTFEISISGRVTATLSNGQKLNKKGNLKGTARTLDNKNGGVALDDGIISRGGLTVFDDSDGLVIEGEKIMPTQMAYDKYYFAFGDDYRGALKAFYALTGEIPLIPKYALGNWWSRYKAYSQQEYIDLMQEFIDREIPINVATVDMDWHWVNVVNKFGKEVRNIHSMSVADKFFSVILPGWTGYTWNTDLFPDHKAFLNWLKEHGMKVPLNIHPSQGIRFFEEQYEAVCKKMGVDPETKTPIPFDLSNPKFLEAYFELIHRPLEEEGIDCWWIDWQQGKKCQIKGLDPLWALNHYHYLDMSRGEKRPLILSRYAKIGSHRYPLGFSGDTIISWKSLDFQPYFTANAANVGYTWWSHDIGGHRSGAKDDELYIRWLQLGVFSPINRLHSTADEFSGKEPWKNSKYVEELATKYLKLRYKLLPYLYTANYNSHKNGIAICEPLYYTYKEEEAYKHKNEYIFGGKLLCAPITKPRNKVTGLADVEVYLPEKVRYTDIFTGNTYMGGETIRMYRDVDTFPVLAKEGTIIPMYKNTNTNDLSLEQPLEIWIYRGTGTYSLYEDDGETTRYQTNEYSISNFAMNITPNGYIFEYKPTVSGEMPIPLRPITFIFKDIVSANIKVNGAELTSTDKVVTITIVGACTVELTNCKYPETKDKTMQKIDVISRYQMSNFKKTTKFKSVASNSIIKTVLCKPTDVDKPKQNKKLRMRKSLRGPIEEIDKLL